MAPTSMSAKLLKFGMSWHALCYCVGLVLACLASYPGFLAIAFAGFAASGLVVTTEGKRWVEKACRYDANNFRVSCHARRFISKRLASTF